MKLQQHTKNNLWDQIKWSYNQGSLKIKCCKTGSTAFLFNFNSNDSWLYKTTGDDDLLMTSSYGNKVL